MTRYSLSPIVSQLNVLRTVADVTGTDVDAWGSGPDIQMWTHVHGTDSMYLALLCPAD